MKLTRLFHLSVFLLSITAIVFGGGKSEKQNVPGPAPSPVSASLNATGFPIVKDPISMTVFGQRDPNHAPWVDVKVLKEYEKTSNVHMVYQEGPMQGYDEKKNLLFASNSLPDVFLRANLNTMDIAMYGMLSKQIIPLEKLIDQYAPNIKALLDKYPEIRKGLTAPDGHVYTIPQISTAAVARTGFKQWVNEKWLQKLGKKAPTTPEEFYDLLVAIRDKDPNGNGQKDEIPLGIREPSSIYTVLIGSWGLQAQMQYQINIVNDKVKIWLTDERFKNMLQYLNKLYREKLIWQDYYKNDRPKWRSNLVNGLFGVFFMPYSDVFLNRELDYIGFAPIKGPYGDQQWNDYITPIQNIGSFAISNKNKTPEVAIRWVDYFFSKEGALFFAYGKEGDTYVKNEQGLPVYTDVIMKDPRGYMTAMGNLNLVPGNGFPYLQDEVAIRSIASNKTYEVQSLLTPFLPKTVYAQPIFDKDTFDRINPIKTDIDKYRDETVTRFIIGEIGFDRWDEYVQTLKKMGLDELEKAYQVAYDVMKKS